MTLFEWDEAKRLANIQRHKLDFIDAVLLFGHPHITGDARMTGGEPRLMATGKIDDVYVTAIYTMRGDVIRMISLRRARDAERARYQALHGG